MPFVSRTRATFRSAEFGFFGVWVKTRTHTPRFCGLLCSAGLFVLVRTLSRPLRTSWLIVGIHSLETAHTDALCPRPEPGRRIRARPVPEHHRSRHGRRAVGVS